MLGSLLKGFKIFANKKTILIIVLFLASMLGLNYLINYIANTIYLETSFSQIPIFLTNYYGYELLLFILGFFFLFALSNYVSYLIAHTVLHSKKNIYEDISKVLIYSLFTSVIFLFIYLLAYLILLNPGIISIILLIILAIMSFVISLVIGLAVLFLPVSKTTKESLERSWLFLKKKFWLLFALLILLGIINFIFSFIFEYLNILLLSGSIYGELILQSVANTILTMYTVAVFAYFMKKK
ncbi:MAG: hypothetical protein WC932_05555 [archaeon]|jgi:hypothetical protein